MLVDLTAQLDKTNKLLRHHSKHHTKSEQLSPGQLLLFIEELKKAKTDFHGLMPAPATPRVKKKAALGYAVRFPLT